MKSPKTLLAGLTAGLVSLSTVVAHPSLTQIPSFTNVSVHDPSVVRDGSTYYVFGSHMASASTPDLMHWTQITTSPAFPNSLIRNQNPQTEFADALTWAQTTAFWAPDVIKLGDGKYYYYYCACRGDSPLSALGLAVSDSIAGPYANVGIMLKSGMSGISPDGTIYNVNVHPNVVDPSVFFDQTGKLWMVYGSFSGGIFILQLDATVGSPTIGQPLPNQGYGKKLIGGNSSRIEGSFIIYSPETQYYYLFMTFGGLDAAGGYNIRVGRSLSPNGPYFDAAGSDLTNVKGNFPFDDATIAPYGVKLIGNWQFLPVVGEPLPTSRGYVSPGGCSINRDPVTGKYFLVFHSRFVGNGEYHEVRVHQLYLNADGWFVAAPQRYAGETLQRLDRDDVPGDYKIINHGKAISPAVQTSFVVKLETNGSISGAASGRWHLSRDNAITVALNGVAYDGVFSVQWDDDQGAWVYTFSALSMGGVSLWGSHVVTSNHSTHTTALPNRLALYGETMTLAIPEPSRDRKDVFSYSIVEGPPGLSIDRGSGVLTWSPMLAQVDVDYPVTVLAVNTSPDDPRQNRYTFMLTARSANVLRRVDLNFSTAASAGLQDVSGLFTGLTTRLGGTGAALSALDPNLRLDTAKGVLELSSTQADFNGQVGLPAASAPGIDLSRLGFTGTEDFSVNVVFRPLVGLAFIDQVGVYVGSNSNFMTRADTIVFANPERHSTHTQKNFDYDGHFFGFGLNVADGMTVTIFRKAGAWHSFINNLEWNPLSAPTFLDGRADLVAGVFAITPLNNNQKKVEVESYSLIVATNVPQLTPREAWRIRHFGQVENRGIPSDHADPDDDDHTIVQDFENNTDPQEDKSPDHSARR